MLSRCSHEKALLEVADDNYHFGSHPARLVVASLEYLKRHSVEMGRFHEFGRGRLGVEMLVVVVYGRLVMGIGHDMEETVVDVGHIAVEEEHRLESAR